MNTENNQSTEGASDLSASPVFVNHLLNVFKETDAFMTCESGGEDGYCVKMKFANIEDSHKMHAAILALISHNTKG